MTLKLKLGKKQEASDENVCAPYVMRDPPFIGLDIEDTEVGGLHDGYEVKLRRRVVGYSNTPFDRMCGGVVAL